MIAGPLTIFVLGFIVGFIIAWKIAGGIMLRRVRNEGIERENTNYERRRRNWI